MSKELPVLDLEKALDVVSNNRSLADDLLAMLIKAIPDYKLEINKQQENRDELKLMIHKIYGALHYIGTPALMMIISETNNNLFAYSEEQLSQKVEKIFIEFERIVEQKRYKP